MKALYLLLFFFLFQSAFSQSEKKDYSEAYNLIEVWLDAQKDFDELPGITAGVVQDQETIWKGSFGKANPETDLNADPSTLFSICSISKLFTAVAIMKLYDEGKLRLDDKIEDLLPGFDLQQQFPSSGPITVRTLLTHSSGLPREANFPYWTGPDFPFPEEEQVMAELKEQKTLYPASKYFQYSNLGLTLLGEIIEEVSGFPYDEYVQKNILQPLRLSATRTSLPEDLYGKQLAVGYSALTRDGNRSKVNFFQAKGIRSAAGFSSNVEDLASFASWQFRLLDKTETEILKPSTLQNMYNVHWMDPDWDTTWGLGFSVYKGPDGKRWVSHGGSCPGYRSVIQLNPSEKRAYAVMINAGGTNPAKYAKGIHGILEKAKKSSAQKATKDLSGYRGYYDAQPWGSEIYVSPWQGRLAILSLPSDNPAENLSLFKHLEKDTFQRIRDDGEPGETITFERDSKGEIFRMERHGNYSSKINR